MSFDTTLLWEKLKNESTPRRRQSTHDKLHFATNTPAQKHRTNSPKQYNTNTQNLLRLLQANDLKVRRQALDKLKMLVEDDSILRGVEATLLVGICRNLVILLNEGTEKHRAMAGSLLKNIIHKRGSDMKPLLKYLMPLLRETTKLAPDSNRETIEQLTEEIRSINAEILLTIVHTFQQDIEPFLPAVHSIVLCLCRDVYSKINIVCCEILQALCGVFGLALHQISKSFVAHVAPLLLHRHSRVRIAAIETLSRLIQCGAHEMILDLTAFQNPNMIPIKEFYESCPKRNFIGILMMDNSVTVRIAALKLIRDWLVRLPERVSYISRLLPYVLAALVDPVPIVREKGCNALEELASQYEEDHEEDVKNRTLYLPEFAQGSRWQSLCDLWTRSELEIAHLLQPFTERPRLSTRLLVQSHCGYFIGALCHELTSSDESIVERSLNLFRVVLLLIEETIFDHVHEVRESLLFLISSRPNLGQLEKVLRQVCFLLGRLVDPEVWFTNQNDKEEFLALSKRDLAFMLFKEFLTNGT